MKQISLLVTKKRDASQQEGTSRKMI